MSEDFRHRESPFGKFREETRVSTSEARKDVCLEVLMNKIHQCFRTFVMNEIFKSENFMEAIKQSVSEVLNNLDPFRVELLMGRLCQVI